MTEKKLPAYVPRALPPTSNDLMFANKRPDQMTREELIACAVHFRDEHIAAVHRYAAADRRMKKLEEAVTPAMVKKLDGWLKAHAQDSLRGDGSELYINWQKFEIPKP